MTINDEILIIANQLANQGKKPSVALIKTKMSQPVTLPQLISVLKSWQHDPEFIHAIPKNEPNEDQKNKQPKEELELSQLIAKAITPLEKEISELKKMIQTLIDKN